MVETKHNAANRLRLYLLLSKNTKNKEGFASTMTESLNSLIRLCKLMGKMPKRQIFLQRLLKINLHRCSSYLELWAMRFYLKTSTPPPPNWVTSSINFTGVKVFSFFHEKCASVITEKKWQTAKAKDSLEKKKRQAWIMCDTCNWSHPYNEILKAWDDQNDTARGTTWQFNL